MSKLEEFAKIVACKKPDIDDITFFNGYQEYFEESCDFARNSVIDASSILSEEEYNICMEVIREYEDKR